MAALLGVALAVALLAVALLAVALLAVALLAVALLAVALLAVALLVVLERRRLGLQLAEVEAPRDQQEHRADDQRDRKNSNVVWKPSTPAK